LSFKKAITSSNIGSVIGRRAQKTDRANRRAKSVPIASFATKFSRPALAFALG
jgi:hypothetical protein